MLDVDRSAAASHADHLLRRRDWRWGKDWRICVGGPLAFLLGLYRIQAIAVQSLLAPPDEFGDEGSARSLVDKECIWVLAPTWIVVVEATVASEHPKYSENLACSELS